MTRAGLALLLLLSGCFWRSPREPMPFVPHGNLGPQRARGAIVLLPGFGDEPADFEKHGFLRVLTSRAPGYDVVAADAHFGYYRNTTVITQLHAHVIGPLVSRGYREIWLVGVSMGGHGAVAYARQHPARIAGLLLLAPHLGPGDTVEVVRKAGGICTWQPPAVPSKGRAGFAEANFAWLKSTLCARPAPLQLYVGVGDQDRGASDLLAGLIAPEELADRLVVLPGGHNWAVWTPALDRLAARAFARAGAPVR